LIFGGEVGPRSCSRAFPTAALRERSPADVCGNTTLPEGTAAEEGTLATLALISNHTELFKATEATEAARRIAHTAWRRPHQKCLDAGRLPGLRQLAVMLTVVECVALRCQSTQRHMPSSSSCVMLRLADVCSFL